MSETSCKFNFNGATPFAESCTFPPSMPFPTPPVFSMLSQNSLSLCLVLSLSAEGPWIYQAKLGNTDSDRGNVDRVTSHALTCPFFQRSIVCKPQVENLSLRLPLSFVSFVYSLPAKAKGWIRKIHREKCYKKTFDFSTLLIHSKKAFSCKTPPPQPKSLD